MAGCWVERRLAEMSERDAIEVHIYGPYLFRLKFEGFKKQYKISTKI